MRWLVRCSLTVVIATAAMNVPSYAAPIGDPPSIRVPVAGSDFATQSATESLTARLWSAAREVCKEESWGDAGYMFAHACQSFAMEDALMQVEKIRAGHLTVLSGASIVVAAR